MADISQITLPSGSTYTLKDLGARELIEELSNYTAFLGVTSTALTDGATTNPIIINGESVTAKSGDITTYGSAEFIFNGAAWQAFGDLSALGNLAYKNNASATYTPAGTVSKPSFSGTAGNVSVTTSDAVTGVSGSVNTTASGGVDIKPAGTVSTPTITVTPATGTVNSIDDVGTLPELTTTVTNEILTIGWASGTLPTKGTDTTVVTGITSATSTQPTFSGTQKYLHLNTTKDTVTSTGSFIPSGSVTQPTFSGTEATITVS